MSAASRFGLKGLVLIGIAGLLAGCTGQTSPSWTYPPVAAPAAAAAKAAAPAQARLASTSSHPTTYASLTIVTGDMTGKADWPAYIPSAITLPAYSTVVVTITNFDDATPLPKGSEIYAQVSGTVGNSMAVTPIDAKNPNSSSGPTQQLTSLDPNQVSHTFTSPALGINVPVAPHSRVTFTIKTGAPGSFTWRCFDPCGTGSTGWTGPMSAQASYMQGTITVV